MLDEANAWGSCCYEKGIYLEDLADPVIDVLTGQIPRKNSLMSMLLLYRLDGAYSRVGDGETAFSGGRSPRYAAFIVGIAPDTDQLAADRGWVRSIWQVLQPHAIGNGGGYVNGTSEYSGDRVRASPARYLFSNTYTGNRQEIPTDNAFVLAVKELRCGRRG